MFRLVILVILVLILQFYKWAVADDIVSQEVMEGKNFTISTKFPKLHKDPQIFFTLVKGTSEILLAQLMCHFQICQLENQTPGVLLEFNEDNVTLTLLNINRNQSGIYKVKDLSSAHPKNKIFNVTVYEPPPKPHPSSMSIKAFTPGIGAAVVFAITSLIIGAIAGVICYNRRRMEIEETHESENEMMIRQQDPSNLRL